MSKGICIGWPHLATSSAAPQVPVFVISDIAAECCRYRCAVANSRQDLQALRADLGSKSTADVVQVIDSHIQMLADPLINLQIEERIARERLNAEFILYSFASGYVEKASKSSHPFFRQRGRDIFALAQRILSHLRPQKELEQKNGDTIIFVPELSLFDIARIQEPLRCAFLTQICGEYSHAALAARSRKIPLVAEIREQDLTSTSAVIVDGSSGRVVLNPSPATLDYYHHLQQTLEVASHKVEKGSVVLTQTRDGLQIAVTASIAQWEELAELQSAQVEEVGLVRTEMLLWGEQQLLFDEAGQCQVYTRLLHQVGDRPVTVRLFDLGGEKLPPHFPQLAEQRNPLLGLRGSRFLLAHQEVLVTQLRALLRASRGHRVQLLLPMIADVGELTQLRAIIDAVQDEVDGPHLPLGCMLEVPAAALMVDRFLEHCQFLSIGSNDLAQYTLGIDRSTMHHLYAPLHPSLLRMVKLICMQCQQQGTPLAICGELATVPQLLPLLIGLGVQNFCCSPAQVAALKQAICQLTLLQAIALAERALNLPTAAAVHDLLVEAERSC